MMTVELVERSCRPVQRELADLEFSIFERSVETKDRARLLDTLIADIDGVYHLADFNERLVLGLKGTMSEAEVGQIASEHPATRLLARCAALAS
jgi:hypothetical protein